MRIRALLERHIVPNALAIIAQADGVDEFEVAMEAEEDELEELTYENETLLRDLYCTTALKMKTKGCVNVDYK